MNSNDSDALGAEPTFDYSFLINAAAEAARQGVTYAQQKQAAEVASRSTAEKSAAVIAADAQATSANAALAFAEAMAARPGATTADRAKADAARAVATQAAMAQGIASTGITPEATAKRVEAATKAAQAAAEAYRKAADAYASAPTDKGKEMAALLASATAQAAQATAMRAASGQVVQMQNIDPAQQAAVLARIKEQAERETSWTRHFSLRNVLIGLGVVGAGVGGYLIFRRRK